MRIFDLPIEPYEERYTEQWYRWFADAYKELGVDAVRINGFSLTNTIESGSVLDAYGTNVWKFSQLQRVVEMLRNDEIKDGDVLFFHDLWFPGIEALQYIRNVTGKKFYIYGILHAGTWDNADFTYRTGMRPWARHIERAWMDMFDAVFLGSQFHKDIITRYCIKEFPGGVFDFDKLHVTGIPFEYHEVQRLNNPKENIVVFPHRLDPEKNPELFDTLKQELQDKYPDWKFIKTKDVCSTKEEYYQLLGKSKIAVSFPNQETFGFAMLEAIANNCTTVVTDGLSYRTMDIYKDAGSIVLEGESITLHVERMINKWDKGMAYNPVSHHLEQYRTKAFIHRVLDVYEEQKSSSF